MVTTPADTAGVSPPSPIPVVPRPRVGGAFAFGLSVSLVGLLGLAVFYMDLSHFLYEFFKGFDRDPVGVSTPLVLGGILSFLLPALLFYSIRLRISASAANLREVSRDLRRIRLVGGALFCLAILFTAGVYSAGAAPAVYVHSILGFGMCTTVGFLLLVVRRSIEQVTLDLTGPAAVAQRRGFSVVMPSGTTDAPPPAFGDAAQDRHHSELLAIAVLLAVAMLIIEGSSISKLMKLALDARPISGPGTAWMVPSPAMNVRFRILTRDIPLALGACGVFWTTWVVACLAAGPRWRNVALVFAVLTLATHAAHAGLLVWSSVDQWQTYNPMSYGDNGSSLAVAWAAELALPLVLTVFLSRRAVRAALGREP